MTSTTVELAKGVTEAELIVVCTPVGRIADDVRSAAAHCSPDTLITDAGSTKRMIVEALDDKLPGGCRFLGSHPLAGGEKSGPAHSSADLLEDFWSSLGSMVMQMPADEHDRVLALTSHLPHAVAATLATMVPEASFRLSGAGLLDTTRIAAGDPDLWLPVFMANRENLLKVLRQYQGELAGLSSALAAGDEKKLHEILTRAKNNRNALGN